MFRKPLIQKNPADSTSESDQPRQNMEHRKSMSDKENTKVKIEGINFSNKTSATKLNECQNKLEVIAQEYRNAFTSYKIKSFFHKNIKFETMHEKCLNEIENQIKLLNTNLTELLLVPPTTSDTKKVTEAKVLASEPEIEIIRYKSVSPNAAKNTNSDVNFENKVMRIERKNEKLTTEKQKTCKRRSSKHNKIESKESIIKEDSRNSFQVNDAETVHKVKRKSLMPETDSDVTKSAKRSRKRKSLPTNFNNLNENIVNNDESVLVENGPVLNNTICKRKRSSSEFQSSLKKSEKLENDRVSDQSGSELVSRNSEEDFVIPINKRKSKSKIIQSQVLIDSIPAARITKKENLVEENCHIQADFSNKETKIFKSSTSIAGIFKIRSNSQKLTSVENFLHDDSLPESKISLRSKDSTLVDERQIIENKENQCRYKKSESDLTNDSKNGIVFLRTNLTFKKCDDRKEHEESEKCKEPVEYEVSEIRDYKKSTGKFRVGWNGYSENEDTFEPFEHLDGCDEIIIDFLSKRLKERMTANTCEDLRLLQLPHDQKCLDLLYTAFENSMQTLLSKDILEKGKENILKNKLVVEDKIKDEIKDDILKLVKCIDPTTEKYKAIYTSILTQLSCKEFMKNRKIQIAELRQWENEINLHSTDKAQIVVENEADFEGKPKDFNYINRSINHKDVTISDETIEGTGCSCETCGKSEKNCCIIKDSHVPSYTRHRRLNVSLGAPIYECHKACACAKDPSSCYNRVVQNGRTSRLCIFKTKSKGWGVKAVEKITRNQFVCEYVGEVITSDEAERRGQTYDSRGVTYLFDLDFNTGDKNPYTVDAYKFGNVSHFINHSCDPNLGVYNVWVDCLHPDLPRLAMFALRDINKGDEITFDYNQSTQQIALEKEIDNPDETKTIDENGYIQIPTATRELKKQRYFAQQKCNENSGKTSTTDDENSDDEDLQGKTKCSCGAFNCRGWFF